MSPERFGPVIALLVLAFAGAVVLIRLGQWQISFGISRSVKRDIEVQPSRTLVARMRSAGGIEGQNSARRVEARHGSSNPKLVRE